MKHDFLVEIGTEELPPKALLSFRNEFETSIRSALDKLGLHCEQLTAYASPRRLALTAFGLDAQTPAQAIEVWGPPAKIAFDAQGQPAKPALAFAEKNGIAASELTVDSDGKADKLVYRATQPGQAVSALLPGMVTDALDRLPIPKRMRWGASRTEFVRPLHWIVLLQDEQVIEAEIYGIQTGRESRGHRFHSLGAVAIDSPRSYAAQLEQAYVIADFDRRSAMIVEQVTRDGEKLGGSAVIDSDLLAEVTALVEWPVALTGSFEQRFLAVPQEALIASMSEHQKYFHVVDGAGKLMPYFITVANIESTDPAQVIAGNERVIRPRLSDAAFFYQTDLKTPLVQRVAKLKNIVFQAQLGSLYDKCQRVVGLAGYIAEQIGADRAQAERAALLCKADLVSDMVLEFDNMQGIAGSYYARHDGEPEAVANAISQHYLPKFAGDQLPGCAVAAAVALADRLDTLVGIFGIGQPPTGSKDPFALRRASVGVLRIMVEKSLALDLRECLQQAVAQHAALPQADGLAETVLNYMLERFRAWYEEARIPAEVFMAVSAKQLSQPLDIHQRVQAVDRFNQMPQAQALAAANKRVSNILAKLEQAPEPTVDNALLQEAAEQALAAAVASKTADLAPLFAQRQYTEALSALADLREPVDAFFDQVMVMADDPALQANRLALLQQLRNLFWQIADISLLVPAK